MPRSEPLSLTAVEEADLNFDIITAKLLKNMKSLNSAKPWDTMGFFSGVGYWRAMSRNPSHLRVERQGDSQSPTSRALRAPAEPRNLDLTSLYSRIGNSFPFILS